MKQTTSREEQKIYIHIQYFCVYKIRLRQCRWEKKICETTTTTATTTRDEPISIYDMDTFNVYVESLSHEWREPYTTVFRTRNITHCTPSTLHRMDRMSAFATNTPADTPTQAKYISARKNKTQTKHL